MAETSQLTEENARLGFISVLGSVKTGLVGGLLIIDRLGHPKEFHCTVPVCPNPAQEILYGASLQAFLYGRHIADALLRKTSLDCFAIMTNSPYVLSLQTVTLKPVMMLFPSGSPIAEGFSACDPETLKGLRTDDWVELPPDALHTDRLAVLKTIWGDPDRRGRIKTGLELYVGNVDLAEPFDRITMAIQESQK